MPPLNRQRWRQSRQAFENAIEFANAGCRAETTQAIPRSFYRRLGIEFRLDSSASYQIHRFSRAWILQSADARTHLFLDYFKNYVVN